MTSDCKLGGNLEMPKRLEGDFDYIVVGAGTAGCIVATGSQPIRPTAC